METALVGAFVGATVQVMLPNVFSKILECKNIGLDYSSDLEKLNTSFNMVQKYLSDAEAKKVGDAVQEWHKQLEDASFEADAVLDKVKYEFLRHQVEQDRDFNSLIFPGSVLSKWNLSGQMKKVINKLKEIKENAEFLQLQSAPTNAAGSETDAFSIEPYVVGREAYVLELVEKLTAPPQEMVSVVGMGGVGKTTVARIVFNNEKITKHFGEKLWLSVSSNVDAVSLFNMILGALTLEGVEFSRQIALQKIEKLLVNKTYLIVLDDVRYEKDDKWNDFMSPLSTISNVNGNYIVVTSRSKYVNLHVRTLSTCQLGVLTETQCWSIIKEEAFRGKDVPKEIATPGEGIARKCLGLPLAAKVAGGSLRGKSEGDWRSYLQKLSNNGDNTVKNILRSSYDNSLSSMQKKCFAYCSIFPKDYRIESQQVIELWMAEGFLQDGTASDMEIEGIKIFNHLLQQSLFQDPVRNIFCDIFNCKMHDFIHDLACSISKDMHQVRYLELESNELHKMMSLRTLFFNGKIADEMFSSFKCLHVLKLTNRDILELPLAIGNLIHLRLLDISLTQVKLLPDSIGNLYLLQTLSMSMHLLKLPNTIINLVSLRYLHISADTELPAGIGKLTSLRTLRHYKVRNENGRRIGELGKLKNLKGELEIENLEMAKDKEEAKLADLYGKPDILRLVLRWKGHIDFDGKQKEVLEGLQPHRHLKSLKIFGYGHKILPLWTMRMAIPNNVADPWDAFNSLDSIKLEGFSQLRALPVFAHLPRLRVLLLEDLFDVRSTCSSSYVHDNYSMTVLFPALECLQLFRLPELTDFIDNLVDVDGGISVFPCLKVLRIEKCPKLKSLHRHFPCLTKLEVEDIDANLLTNICSNTSSLQNIEIKACSGLVTLPAELFVKNKNLTGMINCPKLTRLVPESLGGGASIKTLSIWECENLIKLADDLCTLCNLERLDIDGCPGLKSIPYDVSGQSQGLTSLRHLSISSCKGLKDLPIRLLESCTSSLESLILINLETLGNLDTLFPCIVRMLRLRKLILKNIPKFMKFPKEISCLRSLWHLDIMECKGLTELPVALLESCTTSLEFLQLDDLENLENLDTLIPCIGRMLRLRNLRLTLIPKLMIFPTEIGCLKRLAVLDIGGFSESINAVSFNDGLAIILHQCRSLEMLVLHGKEHWDSLPESIQIRNDLPRLAVGFFGIESIPEWIGNSSSLQHLIIHSCKKLRHFPSKEATKHITTLHISDCPLLKERCSPLNTKPDSEWPKISHIQTIIVDGNLQPTK